MDVEEDEEGETEKEKEGEEEEVEEEVRRPRRAESSHSDLKRTELRSQDRS